MPRSARLIPKPAQGFAPITDNRYNLLIAGAIGLGCVVFIPFAVALTYSTGGEVAGAFGAVLGGIVGAGGAVGTVFLLIDRQRQEEARRVTEAVRTEVIGFCKFLTGALECCEHIKSCEAKVPKNNAQSIMIPLDPIIYKSVADRVSLLPFPHLVVAFYIRLVEMQAAIRMILDSPGDPDAFIPASLAETVAEILITACQLAGAIIAYVPGPNLDEQVSRIELANLEAALQSAKNAFPDAAAFNEPLEDRASPEQIAKAS